MAELQWPTRILASPRRHEELSYDGEQWSVTGGRSVEILDTASVRVRFGDEPFRRVEAFESGQTEAFAPRAVPLLGRRPLRAAVEAGWNVAEDADRHVELRRSTAVLRMEPDGHGWMRILHWRDGALVGSGSGSDLGAAEALLVALAEGRRLPSEVTDRFYWNELDIEGNSDEHRVD